MLVAQRYSQHGLEVGNMAQFDKQVVQVGKQLVVNYDRVHNKFESIAEK